MPKLAKNTRKPKVVSGEGYCRRCQKVMTLQGNFYEATNLMLDTNGYLSICKKCCGEIYNHYFSIYNNLEKALYFTCEDLDICFSREALQATQTHIDSLLSRGKEVTSVFGYYKSKLGSLVKKNGMVSFRFRDSDGSIFKNENTTDAVKSNESDFELTDEIKRFWGWGAETTLTKSDYEYLQNKFTEYINNYECETPVMEELLKQASFESLEIHRKRMARQDVSKNLANLQTILTNANIKPVQESGANASDQVSFGLLIKKWENEEPIPEPDEEWKDVDGIGRYIRIWFLGHLCKMLGIVNEYSKEYEEEMAKFRVEMPSDDLLEDELEGQLSDD